MAAISSASHFGVATCERKEQMTGGAIKPDSFLVGAKTTLNAPAGDNLARISTTSSCRVRRTRF